MRIRIRSVLATGKFRTDLLLAVVSLALVIPGGEVAFSQTGTGTLAQTPLFTAIDLNPKGFVESWATGASDGQQVGYGYGPATGGYGHALLWRGTAASAVDLHPSGFMISRALGISGAQQVGVGMSPRPAGGSHALLWRGTAASAVDLHPSGFVQSEASGITGRQQVGWGYGPATGEHRHALLWRGSADTVVDLHPSGFDGSEASGTSDGQQVGWGSMGHCIEGQSPNFRQDCHNRALLWRGVSSSVVDLGEGRAYSTSGEQQVGYGVHTNAVLWTGGAGSMVDLQPSGFYGSQASSTFGGEQVGYGGPWPQTHALLWRGNVSSMVDLHAFLPPGFERSIATGIDSDGNVVGATWGPATDGRAHAFLWVRNANAKPGPILPWTVTFNQKPRGARPAGSVHVSSGSPVELLLTDPLGDRIGYDPVTNIPFRDIPASEYTTTELCDEQNFSSCDPPDKAINMADPRDGQYTLDVTGTESGDFDVYVSISDAAGNEIDHSYSGTMAPGRVSRFTFPGKVHAFAAFEATLKISAASKTFEMNGTFTLGPGGTISPVTQPVSIQLGNYFLVTIPAGSFTQTPQGAFAFKGMINGITQCTQTAFGRSTECLSREIEPSKYFDANLAPTGGNGYIFKIVCAGSTKLPSANPVDIRLAIGSNGGDTSVNANFVQ